MVLRGHGTGRAHAALRLLLDSGLTTIRRCGNYRRAHDFEPKDGGEPVGYVWFGVRAEWTSGQPLAEVLDDLRAKVREKYSRIIVIGDDLPGSTGGDYVVTLTPPSVKRVTLAHLDAAGIDEWGYHRLVDRLDLGPDQLYQVTTPSRGRFVAERLIELHRQQFDTAHIAAELVRTGKHDDDVAEWFETRDLPDRALALAIACFESAPWYPVFAVARQLEQMLGNPEGGEIWPYDPPDLFEHSAPERIHRVSAHLIDHPQDDELGFPHIGFRQPEWGRRLLGYVWRNYEAVRPVLRDWLTAAVGSFPEQDVAGAAARFGTMLTQSREDNALEWIDRWAAADSFPANRLAALSLGSMSSVPEYVSSVFGALRRWAGHGDYRGRLTVAVALQSRIGSGYAEFSLSLLRFLVNGADAVLQTQISKAIRTLVKTPGNRGIVQRELLRWTPRNAVAKRFVRECATIAVGFDSRPDPTFCADRVSFRGLVDRLAGHDDTRETVIRGLNRWCGAATTSTAAAADTLICTLLSPANPGGDRIAYCLRRALHEQPDALTSLRTALTRIVQENDE